MSLERYDNTAAKHKSLLQRPRALRAAVTVCLEASRTYSLDVALASARIGGHVQLQVANPAAGAAVCGIAGPAQQDRSGGCACALPVRGAYADRRLTAALDGSLAFAPLGRTIAPLVRMGTQHKNRQHALAASSARPACRMRELEAQVRYIQKRIAKSRRQAVRVIADEPEVARRWQYLLSVPGLGEHSALAVLGELAVLPVLPDTLDERPWVAHAGLFPKHHESGSSIAQKPRISKAGNHYLRAALYMPAPVAVRHDPALAAFYQRLLAHGKAKLQALVAVMRKLLLAAWGMFHNDQPYDGSKLCQRA